MKTFARRLFLLFLLFQFSLSTTRAQGAAAAPKTQSAFDVLTQSEGTPLTLKFDMSALLNTRKTSEYLPAILTDTSGREYNVEIRSRGKFRRKNCEIPPIKIKFAKSELRTYGLDTLNEIKVVIPCKDNTASEQLILREYTAYRLFEHLSPASFRARVVQMNIVDTEGKNSRKSLCLLAEHEEEVAARLNSHVLEEWGIKPERLDMNQAALMVLFEYMIGNTDWDISAFRNVLLLEPKGGGQVMTVPYDFDFSGLVSAPYSSPASGKGLLTVRDRLLMAEGIDASALRNALQNVKNARSQLTALCRSQHAPKKAVRDMEKFINSFFDAVADKDVAPGVLMEKKD